MLGRGRQFVEQGGGTLPRFATDYQECNAELYVTELYIEDRFNNSYVKICRPGPAHLPLVLCLNAPLLVCRAQCYAIAAASFLKKQVLRIPSQFGLHCSRPNAHMRKNVTLGWHGSLAKNKMLLVE